MLGGYIRISHIAIKVTEYTEVCSADKPKLKKSEY